MATNSHTSGKTYEDSLAMEPFHFEIHEGEAYNSSVTTVGLSATGVAEALIETGPKELHFNFAVSSDNKGIIDFFSGSTASVIGTPVSTTNMDTTSPNTASVTIYDGPTITGAGTTIGTFLLPTAGTFTTSDILRDGTEWILSPSSYYLIRYSVVDGSDVDVTMSAQWYEKE